MDDRMQKKLDRFLILQEFSILSAVRELWSNLATTKTTFHLDFTWPLNGYKFNLFAQLNMRFQWNEEKLFEIAAFMESEAPYKKPVHLHTPTFKNF